jgi:hypothetical protein
LPTLICLALATGIAAALAGRVELRVSPRPALLTRSFMAYVVFAALVLVPVSVYFYVFHGDWFLLYAVDVRQIPSALALLGFVLEVGVGALGFMLGAAMVRSQRDGIGGGLAAVAVLAGGAAAFVARDRLGVVGSFAQYHNQFGLEPYAEHAVLQGAAVMGAILLVGIGSLVARLHVSGRRGD